MTTQRFSFLRKYKEDLITLLILFLASIPVRVIQLANIPYGLHGDEAWTGLDARLIVNDGFIAPYIGSALGQPTGPMYLTALLFKVFGESIFTLRLSMAIFGILTVTVFYIFLRLFVRKEAAFLGTIGMAFSLYHIHFSRLAFMLVAAPLFQLLGLIFLFLGRRKNNLIMTGISGLFVGLGMYSYNSYLLFPLTIFLLFIYDLFSTRFKKIQVKRVVVFITVFIIMSFPLLKIMVTESDFYFAHHKAFFITNTRKVKPLENNTEKLKVIIDEGIKNTKGFFLGNKVDGADGFGKYHTFGFLILGFFALGFVSAVIKKDKKYLFFIFSFILFLSSCILTLDGTYRRQILNVPYVYLFSAVGIEVLLSKLKNHRLHDYLFVLLFVFVVLDSFNNVYTYFEKFRYDNETDGVFGSLLMKRIEVYKNYNGSKLILGDTHWKCKYETVRFMIPDAKCED